MLWANSGVGAQIALFNSGALRDAVPSAYRLQDQTLNRPGKGAAPWSVVVGDVYNALSLSNSEIVVRLSGQDIWAVCGRWDQCCIARRRWKTACPP